MQFWMRMKKFLCCTLYQHGTAVQSYVLVLKFVGYFCIWRLDLSVYLNILSSKLPKEFRLNLAFKACTTRCQVFGSCHYSAGQFLQYLKPNLTSQRSSISYLQYVVIGDFKFERIDSFTYLGSVLDNGNKMWTDIRPKIMAANLACSAHNNILKSKLSFGNTKFKICKIDIFSAPGRKLGK